MTVGEKLVQLYTLVRSVRETLRSQGDKLDALRDEVAEARDVVQMVREIRREVMLWAVGAAGTGGLIGWGINAVSGGQ